jgi:hypothetical protein
MIRKLLSDRVLFTVGVALTAWGMIYYDYHSVGRHDTHYVRTALLVGGPGLAAYALFSLISGLATGLRSPRTHPHAEDSTGQAERRNAA